MSTPTPKQEPSPPRPVKKQRTHSPPHSAAACDHRVLELTKLVHHLERKSRGTLGGLSLTLGALMAENRTLKQMHHDLAWRCELARTPDMRLRLQKEKPQGPGLFTRRFERLVRRVDALNHDFQERHMAGRRGECKEEADG